VRFVIPIAVAILTTATVPAAVAAEAVKQTVQLAKVDVTQVAAGYRASKVIGSSVVNDANETIGSIDDLIVSQDGKDTFAIVTVGGFLGMGSKLVAVPYSSLQLGKAVALPGASKDSLMQLPEFKYASR
jgi:hypothetical protein